MLKTPLYSVHTTANARMVDFGGWSMPVSYSSIIEEHNWTRTNIGLFDVSHMGRLEICGLTAAESLEYLCTRDMIDLEPGETRYCLMCNEDGGVLDDIMVSRLEDEKFYIVCNASNREKIVDHIQENLKPGSSLIDKTFDTAMIAIQGPKAMTLVSKVLPGPISELKHRSVHADQMMGINFIAFRGGYTGEDGLEVVFPANIAPLIWNQLTGATLDDKPVTKAIGLGARDTLRLEAGLPLYGHEMDENVDPITAKLGFAVSTSHEFIGKDAIVKIQKAGSEKVRVGLKLEGRRAARHGFKVFNGDEQIGEVTSGAFTPTVNASIAMAQIKTDLAVEGNTVQIEIGKDKHNATIVKLPFYRRPK